MKVMYWTRINDLPDLHHRIIDAIASITPEMLRNIWTEIEYKFGVCCSAREARVKSYCHDKVIVEFLHLSPQIACMYLHWK
jgi:hypothetical protein